MYSQFFNLKQTPFSIAPDPRYLFMSERHREALAHLLYGVNSGGGFVLLTGEIGAGKTTICRCFLKQVPANCNVAYIFNPKLTVNELLHSICDEFRIGLKDDIATAKAYVDALTAYLLDAHAGGRNNVLIIDEAQNLSADVLEQLRLLTNLETSERKLLQIILIGQPELRRMLARPELEQLAQRVIARFHLDSLSAVETAAYILHRMSVAGSTGATPFTPRIMRLVHAITQGVPRRINLLCDRALLGAYAEDKYEIDRRIVNKAAAEVFGKAGVPQPGKGHGWRYAAWGMAAGAALSGVTLWALNTGWPVPANGEGHGAASLAIASPRAARVDAENRVAGSNPPLTQGSSAPTSGTASAQAGPHSSPATPVSSAANGPSNTSNTSAWDRDDAIRELAQLWGLSLEQGAPCQLVQRADVHCYISNSADLAEIRLLNRPAILTLHDASGEIYYALLTGLTNTDVTLRIGGTIRTLAVSRLTRIFQGKLVTLWRAPDTYREIVGLGYHGAETDWIALQLAKMNGAEKPDPGRTFDQEMVKQVRKFQLAHGLQADGVVGPKTFMQLNRIAGVKEPQLQARAATAVAPSQE
jgi:general secretion pathway protein A